MNYIKTIALCIGLCLLASCSRVQDNFVILKKEPVTEYTVLPEFMARAASGMPLPPDRRSANTLSNQANPAAGIENDSPKLPFPRKPPLKSGPASSALTLSTTPLQADIAVEVDYEMHLKLGNDIEKSKHYVKELFRALNVIYKRDSNIVLNPSFVRIWTSSNDPWFSTSSFGALSELQNYWFTNHKATPRAVVLFLSGKTLGGGVAYLDAICSKDESTTNIYDVAVAGNLNGYFTESPSYDTWDLVVVAHELGHSFGSSHSHCTISTQTGDYYDKCYSGESSACYGGPVVATNGVLMSYCHLNGGMPAMNPLSFMNAAGDPTMRNVIRSGAEQYSTISNANGCIKPYVETVASPHSWLPAVLQFLLD